MQYDIHLFSVWLTSLSIIISRSIHVAASGIIFLNFMAEYNRFWSASFSRSCLDLHGLESLHKVWLSGSRLPYMHQAGQLSEVSAESVSLGGEVGQSWHPEITSHRRSFIHGKPTAIITLCRWGNGAGEITRAPRVVTAGPWTLAARLQACALTLCAALEGGWCAQFIKNALWTYRWKRRPANMQRFLCEPNCALVALCVTKSHHELPGRLPRQRADLWGFAQL